MSLNKETKYKTKTNKREWFRPQQCQRGEDFMGKSQRQEFC